MKLGVLFSGGKDSAYAAYLAKKQGHELVCLISVVSKNKESYMFHTPNILETKTQAKLMNLPLLIQKTKGEKEKELEDLISAIQKAKKKYKIEGLVTGAVKSDYQASRIKQICENVLGITSINPLWQKNEKEYLEELIKDKFKVIIVGVFAYPLDEKWLGREINESFVKDINILNEKYSVNLVGEGGEFETFVLNCPLFSKSLKVFDFKDIKEGENAWRREIKVK
jgi:ABC transporter with metal-binding/Fe-S-binding domain ATP-binding protein